MQIFPAELLTCIFTLCTTWSHDNAYPAFLPVTHVCNHWRTTALSSYQLWTTITPNMPLRWIEAFMERSKTLLMDFDLRIASVRGYLYPQVRLRQEDVTLLLKGFTRVRSLCFRGCRLPISRILNSLRHMLPIQSLSLFLDDCDPELILPDDLFGGTALIRLQIIATMPHGRRVIAPQGLLRGVLHFTSTLSYTPSDLLYILCQMPALTYFEYKPFDSNWSFDRINELASPIQMPELKHLIVHTYTPREFILLNRQLLLHADAKRRMQLYMTFPEFNLSPYWVDFLSPIAEAANGFKHVHVSGSQKEGRCRLWTGDTATTWEGAKFCLSLEWSAFDAESFHHFITMCDRLGVAQVRKLVIDSPNPGLPALSWWKILETLPGIEELELYATSVVTLDAAWSAESAPAVLPALRKVLILDPTSELESLRQYEIIENPPVRKIVYLPSSTEGDVARFSEVVPAEKELENMMSKPLLKLLRGFGRNLQLDPKKEDGVD